MSPLAVTTFWFEELTLKDWFKKDEALDQTIKEKFESTLKQAKEGALFKWRKTPLGRLAEIIVLDQFPRNIYRDTPQAFEADTLALILAQEAVLLGEDLKIEAAQRTFFYYPYMHSESPAIHQQALKIFTQHGNKEVLKYEIRHKEIIDKFSRYPHRNKILGRTSTPEEIIFLEKPGSTF